MDSAEMFYCCDNTLNSTEAFSDRCMMLSGGMVFNISSNFTFSVPPCESLFIDSGGFQATEAWDMSYPYDPEELFTWADSIGADYVALPDFACEPELHPTSVRDRIHRTVEEHAYGLAQYKDGDYDFQPVPVLQGYYPEQYQECIKLFRREGLIRDYMAVGTVCKRESVDAIHTVMDTIEQELPNTEFHMFGMTLNAWKDRRMWGRFRSADTAAWNWGAGTVVEKKQALSEYSAKVDSIADEMTKQETL